MGTFRFFSLLGLFASVGVALAIGVAVCLTPQPPPATPAPSAASRTESPLNCPKTVAAAPADKPRPAPEHSAAIQEKRPAAVVAQPPLPVQASAFPPAPQPVQRRREATAPLPPPVSSFVFAQTNPRQAGQPITDRKDLDALVEQLQELQQAKQPAAAPESIPAPQPNTVAESTGGVGKKKGKSKGEIVSVPAAGNGEERFTIIFPESDVREILDHLADFAHRNILVSKMVQGKTSVRLNNVNFDTAVDAIVKSSGLALRRDPDFVYVGTPEEFNAIEQSHDRVSTRVYRPNYVAAADLQTLIAPLLTEKIGAVSVSAPAEVGIPSDPTAAGGNKFSGGEVVLVRDYEAVLAQVDVVVSEVDVRPMQVAIEAMILSVTLDDTDSMGIDWEFLRSNPNVRLALGTPLASTSQIIPTTPPLPVFAPGTTGLQFAYLDSNLGAFVNALEQIAETNVIATPRLMALNRQRAEIVIGRKQGYMAQTTQTETSTTSGINFLETGTILRLRPFISSDGLIRLEIHPELSTGNLVEMANQVLPDSDVTQVTTNVMVRDGCTVILGGLIREELDNNAMQVPFFGNLPVVGPLFRTTNQTVSRHEILILLTPHIVYEPESGQEGEKAAGEFHRRQALYAEKMNPLGKRYLARQYFRLAQNAWAAGDRTTALRMAELSVQFDPENRAAIDLRSNIWQNQPLGEHTIPPAPEGPAVGNPLDGKQLPDWLLSDLEHPPAPPAMPLHPYDPGQPGRHIDVPRPRTLP